MSDHQHDPNANELWPYFQDVIAWVKLTFTKYRKEMKGVDWGALYNQFKDEELDTAKLEDEIEALMQRRRRHQKRGIYSYVLNGEEKHLGIRAFTEAQRREAYERQKGGAPMDHCLTPGMRRQAASRSGDGSRPHHPVVQGRQDRWQPTARCSAADCNRKKGGK